jgi:hypothetical protein
LVGWLIHLSPFQTIHRGKHLGVEEIFEEREMDELGWVTEAEERLIGNGTGFEEVERGELLCGCL